MKKTLTVTSHHLKQNELSETDDKDVWTMKVKQMMKKLNPSTDNSDLNDSCDREDDVLMVKVMKYQG
ncbi:MAG: hypothetical protein ACLRWM_02160 [Streptococcus sp.]